jgi:DNA-binding transcriptional regulator LsrR (DeoR family)
MKRMREVCPTCGRSAPGKPGDPERDARILQMYDEGKLTQAAIARRFRVSSSRVGQIVAKARA